MKKIILLIAILTSGIVQAKKVLMAICEMGEGCTFSISEASAEDMEVVYGYPPGTLTNMPENAILVHYKAGKKQGNYIERKLTRGQLDRFYGGDGYTQIYLFDPRIQPLSGQWTSQVGTVSASECYVDILSILQGIQGMKTGGNITFSKPFHPRFLMDSPEVKWIQASPNSFKGLLNFGIPDSPMSMVYNATVVNEKRIEGVINYTIKIPVKGTCTAQIPIVFTCVKPDEEKKPDYNFPGGNNTDVPILTDADDELLDIDPGKKPGNNKPGNTHVDRIPDENHTPVDILNEADEELLDIKP